MSELYELGPSANGLYGLFDAQRNFFYQVHFDKLAVDYLSDLISHITPVSVVPLHYCANWHRNLIDNTNCTQWGISAFRPDARSSALINNDVCLVEYNCNVDSKLQVLIDNLEYLLKMLFYILPVEPTYFECCIPKKIQVMFADDAWINQAIGHELSQAEQFKNSYAQHMKEIQSIPKNFKIDQIDYRELVDLEIKKYCLQVNENFFTRKNLCLI
jgi:hypothetical protein